MSARWHVRLGSAPVLGVLAGLGAVAVVAALFVPVRDDVSPATPALALVVPVVVAGIVGGGVAAVITAFAAAWAYNLAFVRPYWTWHVEAFEDAVALGVLLLVALSVGGLVARERARHRAAEQRADEIARLYAHLERVTDERARLAEEAERVAALESLDEQRTALLRSVSHDLRTPLSTIRAVASDLRDGAEYDDATRRELLASVCDEAERLDRLVANLLSMSRIEAGSLRPDRQSVDLDELVRDAARRLRPLFGEHKLGIDTFLDLPLVDADYSQIDQVVANLLENAARHAPPGSVVKVTLGAHDGCAELRVADRGPGVPVEMRERIFEPFQRGETSRSSGLGLAICRAFVEAHGGTIAVEETAGGGATFVVRLPASTQ